MKKLLIAVFVLSSTFALACASKGNDGGEVVGGASGGGQSGSDPTAAPNDTADESEASGSATQTSDIEQTMFSGVTSNDPAAAASAVAAAQWWPAGCATRSKDASNPLVVHIHLDNCSGPFGIVKHTGDITVTFSKNAAGDGLHAEAASSDMTINGKPVTFSSSRDITASAGMIDVKGNAAWTREDAAGDTVSHTTAVETVIDVAKKCRMSNGSAVTMIGAREVDSSLTDYEVCREADGADACPSGTVTHTHKATGRTVTVKFDGSDKASVTGPKGNTIEVPLICGA